MTHRALGLLVMSLGVTACAVEPPLEQQRSAAGSALLNAQQYAAPTRQQLARVSYSESLYAPPLRAADKARPSWYSAALQLDIRDYPLQQALLDTLAPYGVGLRLETEVDRKMLLTMRHDGTVGEWLEAVARDTGLAFEVQPQLIVWSQFEIAEFDVAFLAGETNFFLGDEDEQAQPTTSPANPMLGNTGTSFSTNSSQYLNFSNSTLSVWHDLEQAIAMLLSPAGKLAINQSSTSVLVRDYPQQVAQVREYLQLQNKRLTQQVAINVQVLEVTFNDQDQRSVDWQLLRQFDGLNSILGVVSEVGNRTVNELVSGTQLGIQQTQGRYQGSQALITALHEQGLVSVSNQPRLVTLNNQIAKLVLQDNATYLAAAGTNSTANVGSSDVLIPGVIATGFELYVLPKVRHDEVILQISTSLSDLQRIDEVSSGDMSIQTPHTTRKSFFMKAMVTDGQTLLLSGLQNKREQQRRQQNFGSWLLGGGVNQEQQQSEILLLITPHIVASDS